MGRGLSPTFHRIGRQLLAATMLLVSGLFPTTVHAVQAPEINAKHAVVIDAESGEVLYDKQMNARRAPASLTKIFTAAVALDSGSLDQTMTVDPYDLVGEASMGLRAGERVSLKTLLYGLMLPSGNDAAMTIARNIGHLPGDSPQQSVNRFMERVNATARRIGLEDTKLANPHGLDQSGHRTTARDIAAMTMYALKDPDFRRIIGSSYYQGDGHEVYQVNRLVDSYPGAIGGKTGITDKAGYCLMEVAERDGHTVIAVLLGSTQDAWYEDARTLLDYGFQSLAEASTSADRPRISLAPVAPAPVTAVATPTTASANSLTVDRVGKTTAIVHPSNAPSEDSRLSWRWPLMATASMGLVLLLMLNYPVILGLGGLAWQSRRGMKLVAQSAGALAMGTGSMVARPVRRPRSRAHRRSNRRRNTVPAQGANEPVRGVPPKSTWAPRLEHPHWETRGEAIELNGAAAIATRAIRLASRGEYNAAASEFVRALRTDADYDLTRCPGFWSMQPLGYVAAARAYLLLDRPSDARSLLTVVQLSFGTNRELDAVLRKAVAAIP